MQFAIISPRYGFWSYGVYGRKDKLYDFGESMQAWNLLIQCF